MTPIALFDLTAKLRRDYSRVPGVLDLCDEAERLSREIRALTVKAQTNRAYTVKTESDLTYTVKAQTDCACTVQAQSTVVAPSQPANTAPANAAVSNATIITRIKGLAAKQGTPETDADPRNPNDRNPAKPKTNRNEYQRLLMRARRAKQRAEREARGSKS
jgi:hypothetical protein